MALLACTLIPGPCPSPFVLLDRAVLYLANAQGGGQAGLRSIAITTQPSDMLGSIVHALRSNPSPAAVEDLVLQFSNGMLRPIIKYSIVGNRWCGRIGREHKSNHVLYSVDLCRGAAWQSCMDPECRRQKYRCVRCRWPFVLSSTSGRT